MTATDQNDKAASRLTTAPAPPATVTKRRADVTARATALAPRTAVDRSRRTAVRSAPAAMAVTDDLAGAALTELRNELDRAVAGGDNEARSPVHELIAGCLAARGEWMQAYLELRAAVDLARGEPADGEQDRRLLEEVALLRREAAEAQQASFTDSLTETFNRRFLDRALLLLTEQSAEDPSGAAVQTCFAFLDLDLFKQVNETFGHAMGDQVLQRVVELLQTDLPPRSFCARYGGEEFVLVLAGFELEQAVALCERTRARIEGEDWSRLADGLRVTVSAGVAGPRSSGTGEDGAQGQLLRADSLLRAAKNSGRNAVAFRASATAPVQLAGAAGLRRIVHDAPRG